MSYLERVDCIFQFLGDSPQFAVVEEYTCNICVEGSDFDCVADFSAAKIFIQLFESIYCKNFFYGLCPFPYLTDSPVTCFSSTSRYLVGLFHTLLS